MIQEFVQQISDLIREIIGEMHTAIPGKIVSFDPKTCLATVEPQMLLKKPDGEKIPYPHISGVPVVIPQACSQNATIAFPVRSGDGCLLIASEQSLDYWQYGQDTSTDLKFDLSNAICIPGLFNKPNSALREACEQGKIVISAPEIAIQGSVDVRGNLSVNGRSVHTD